MGFLVKVTGVFLLLFLMAVLGFFSKVNSWTWHQKLTVSVQTPEGLVIGSSVMRGRLRDLRGAFVPAEAIGTSFSLRGEAVVIELPGGRYLFALVRGTPSASWLLYPKVTGYEAGERMEKIDGSNSPQLALPLDQYPILMTFGDINNPASARKVEPHNLTSAFGRGYRLNSITLKVTDEPVTKGKVRPLLPWLDDYYNKRLDGQRFGTIYSSNRFANSLASGAFDTKKQ